MNRTLLTGKHHQSTVADCQYLKGRQTGAGSCKNPPSYHHVHHEVAEENPTEVEDGGGAQYGSGVTHIVERYW